VTAVIGGAHGLDRARRVDVERVLRQGFAHGVAEAAGIGGVGELELGHGVDSLSWRPEECCATRDRAPAPFRLGERLRCS
jgi:hypothetical protein